MTFIRTKEIPPGSGNWYDYEVRTIHEGAKVKQKVVRYLGKHEGKVQPRKLNNKIIIQPEHHWYKSRTPIKHIKIARELRNNGCSIRRIRYFLNAEFGHQYSVSGIKNWLGETYQSVGKEISL